MPAQPRHLYLVWAVDQTFSSTSAFDVMTAGDPASIADWSRIFVQIDTLDSSAGTADGDFQWALEDTLSQGTWAAWRNMGWVPLSALAGTSAVMDTGVFGDSDVRAWLRWRVRHTIASTQWVRFRIKLFVKGRTAPDDGGEEELRDGVRQAARALDRAGVTPAGLVAAAGSLVPRAAS